MVQVLEEKDLATSRAMDLLIAGIAMSHRRLGFVDFAKKYGPYVTKELRMHELLGTSFCSWLCDIDMNLGLTQDTCRFHEHTKSVRCRSNPNGSRESLFVIEVRSKHIN